MGVFNFWRLIRVLYCVLTFSIMFVFVRLWGRMMPSHSYFYSMSWAIGFVPVFFVLFLIARFGLKQPHAALDEPWPMIKQSAFVGLTYAINYWGVSTSAPHVSGPAQVIFSQFPLILAAFLSMFVFKRKYGWFAWGGILVTLAGLLVQGLAPGASGSAPIGWSLVFIAGNLPGAFWAVAFEGFHKATGPDGKTNTMELRMMWTNVFLVVWLLIFIPFFGLLDQPPFDQFISNFWTAMKCVFTGTGGLEGDDCSNAGWVLGVTIPLASLQAHSQVILSRDDTGLFATLALALAPFLADLVFPFPEIMGQYTDPVSKWDGLAAGLCLLGVITYSWAENSRKNTLEEVNNSTIIRWFTSTKVPQSLQWIFGKGYEHLVEEPSESSGEKSLLRVNSSSHLIQNQ